MTTERSARFLETEADENDAVDTPVEEEFPETPDEDDSADDAKDTNVESPTKRARTTPNVEPESVADGTASNVQPPPSGPPAPTGSSTTPANLRLVMSKKLIQTAASRHAFDIPTNISLKDVQTIGKTTTVATYMLNKGTNPTESFAIIAQVVPNPVTGT